MIITLFGVICFIIGIIFNNIGASLLGFCLFYMGV